MATAQQPRPDARRIARHAESSPPPLDGHTHNQCRTDLSTTSRAARPTATEHRIRPGQRASTARTITAPTRSRSSRAWRRSASGPACTSASPAPPACTTSSTRSSTTRSTRRWPATATRSTSPSTSTARSPSSTTAAASPSTATSSGKSAAEVVLTVLHAGGKFDNDSYKVSGGLHGVGVSVRQRAVRDARARDLARRPGLPADLRARRAAAADLEVTGTTKQRGTKVTFKPDRTIFETTEFSFDTLAQRLRELAFLNGGVTITHRRRARRQEPRLPLRRRHRLVRRVPEHRTRRRSTTSRSTCTARRTASTSRSRCSGTTATPRRSTPSPTTSTPTKAARTSPASARR